MERRTKTIKSFILTNSGIPGVCAPESIRQYVGVRDGACVLGAAAATERGNYGMGGEGGNGRTAI